MDKTKIKELLTKEIPENQILIDEPMKKHTSFKIGGLADLYIKAKDLQELKCVLKIAQKYNIPITIIGNGSNLLVKDKGIRGIVLKIDFTNISINGNVITVGAGVKLGELAQRLVKDELTGFEFASGIPGTIGGAIRMNAGAYSGEMKDIVIQTKCFDVEENKIRILSNEEQEFSYRHSIFVDKRYIILEATLQLEKGNKEQISSKMQEYLISRKEKQPINMPSAGSTFKRGKDYITAKLIDECGLKGYEIGDAQVSNIHAGFIVNKGNATAQDVINLIKYVQDNVYEKTGNKIELEIEILGE